VRALVVLAVVLACCACGGRKEATRVPNLRGLSTQAAFERIAGARLCIGRVELGGSLGSGLVVAQRPPAGSRVRPFRRVSFRTDGLASGGEIVDVVTAEGCPLPQVPLFRLPAKKR
jgi:PASTA domain